MVKKSRGNTGLGNHGKLKSQKSGGISKSKAKKSKDSKVKSFKKLYVYRSKDDGAFAVFHAKLDCVVMGRYYDFCYDVTIRAFGIKKSDIVARVACGIEFNSSTWRFGEL